MFFKRKEEAKTTKNYKAIYKSSCSGNTKEIVITEPTNALINFLQKDENIWEVYTLTCVIPINDEGN